MIIFKDATFKKEYDQKPRNLLILALWKLTSLEVLLPSRKTWSCREIKWSSVIICLTLFLQYLRCLWAIHQSRSGGCKIGGTYYKEPILWTGFK
jgi:hypothetical protein